MYAADAGDHAGGGRFAVVHAEGRQLRQLEERGAHVQQPLHPLAGQQLAASGVARPGGFRPPEGGLRHPLAQFGGQRAVGLRVRLEGG
jgi:hypothetical protein